MAASPDATAIPAADVARVLIVDDSVVARAVIAQQIGNSPRFVVVGAVANAASALAFLAQAETDFILLDIDMPGVDGLTALPDLLAAGRGAKVLIVSSSAADGAAASVQALALGAAETLVKPGPGTLSARFGQMLVEKLERLCERPHDLPPTSIVRKAPGSQTAAPVIVQVPPRPSIDSYDFVAIGASTGGIHALGHLLRAVPATFRLPILVTQHLPASFMPYFAAQLAVLSGRPCDVATDRMRVRPGRIIVAPGGAHLRCVNLGGSEIAIRLSTEPAASGCMPSVDPMFTSLAETCGARVLGIVLSGMGRDGAEGARRLHEAGSCIVVQDQASSVVWGMPGAAAALGIADAVMAPDAIGRLIASRRRP